ncbi:NAD(P)H-dependent oxidoreductase [uncultured Roseivirga sp.]|uniref:flavodoxin family protein n=1 Tax=uncultured Roseivirga sp. TaxID=543088 RepID=UPI0030DD9F9E|tara:strand:+ start:68171 stop:68695 length:525 start_codon:yes stop_codon:yes gene_type:complete
MRSIIILGSSRNDGDTSKVVNLLKEKSEYDLIDLNDYDFSYYDYDHKNAGDDFLPMMRNIIDKYDTLVFATPVYWYSMSGIMKVFFDRITDLLEIKKDLGRKLRGKNMAAISCSIGNHLGDHFWLPFSETAKYLGMNYLGSVHTVINDSTSFEAETDKLEKFIALINTAEESSH